MYQVPRVPDNVYKIWGDDFKLDDLEYDWNII